MDQLLYRHDGVGRLILGCARKNRVNLGLTRLGDREGANLIHGLKAILLSSVSKPMNVEVDSKLGSPNAELRQTLRLARSDIEST